MNYHCYLQLIGGFITCFGAICQVIKTIKTKSVKDISIINYLSLLIGIGMMEDYAYYLVSNGSGLMFLITNSMSLILMAIMVGLILKYKNKEG